MGCTLLIGLLFTESTVGTALQNKTYKADALRVIDGDTVVIAASFLPAPLKPELAVRIYGVDTPEKGRRAHCKLERDLAEAASNFTRHFVEKQPEALEVILYRWDKFGGRVLGDLVVNHESLRQGLLSSRLAREYYGGAKQSWCPEVKTFTEEQEQKKV